MKVLGAGDFASPANLALPKPAGSATAAVAQAGVGFGDVLIGMMGDVDRSLRSAERLAVGALAGDVPLQKVVETVIAAEQKVGLTTAVRDKIVAAYLELTRMPI